MAVSYPSHKRPQSANSGEFGSLNFGSSCLN